MQSCRKTSRVAGVAVWAVLVASPVAFGAVGNLTISLGVREQGSLAAGPVGETVTTSSGSVEWIGSTASVNPPQGKLVTPSPCWQTLTFYAAQHQLGTTGTPMNNVAIPGIPFDPVQKFNSSSGNSVLDGPSDPWYVMDSLGITIASSQSGPYTLYIDSIENGGTVFGNFEGVSDGQQRIFNTPSLSGSTSGQLVASPPSTAGVQSTQADMGLKSNEIKWAFIDNAASRWLRLITSGTTDSLDRSPLIRLDKPVTIRFMLIPTAGIPSHPTIVNQSDQPQNAVVCPGGSATFTVNATSSNPPVSYQWERSDPATSTGQEDVDKQNVVGLILRDGGNVSGATTATLTLSGVTLADNGTKIAVNVCDAAGNIASTEATLTVLSVCQCTIATDCPDDANPCTTATCTDHTCVQVNNSDPCDDGNACTENDTCSGGAGAGTPVIVPCCNIAADCVDNDPCTDDTCVTNACQHTAIEGCTHLPFDFDGNGSVDQVDLDQFTLCITGPAVLGPPASGCTADQFAASDVDHDDDVDGDDFATIQRCYSGTNIYDPHCAD